MFAPAANSFAGMRISPNLFISPRLRAPVWNCLKHFKKGLEIIKVILFQEKNFSWLVFT